eukprot:m.51891 g.51891  ORF g.51891 m.51891 type:complete len:67 (-) comp13462_c0_seq2:498-698(-)
MAICYMHVTGKRVATRFICSSSPLLHWYFATILENGSAGQQRLWLSYVVAFHVIGSTLFAAFLPWT